GRISGYDGLDRIDREFGDAIVAAHFPPVGTPTQPVEAGYMANAWMRVRHPDYDHLRHIMNTIGESVRVFAQ
ncbi:MAG: ATP-grasp domain-containing protein, partial [Steroidobacteraceae bacterium]